MRSLQQSLIKLEHDSQTCIFTVPKNLSVDFLNFQTQFLHCIDQIKGEGGENEFVDGFYVENIIRKNYPEEHNILTQTKVDFVDIGTEAIAGEFHKMFQSPIFK